MKNLVRVSVCFSLVFILSRFGGSNQKEYLTATGLSSVDKNLAYEFQTSAEAYQIQSMVPELNWNIEEK